MSDELEIQTQIVDDQMIVEFIGCINEDSKFKKIESVPQKKYVFDFEKVTAINSCGIREWITFIEKLDDKAIITYRRCPQIIIEQINMVHGFTRKGAHIESFYAPYYCEPCDNEKKVLLKTEQITDKKAPIIRCNQCNDDMEFDAIEEQYFQFLSQ